MSASPSLIPTAPLSQEARAAFARLKDEVAALDRIFAGSFTTELMRARAMGHLMTVDRRSVAVRKALRGQL
jgi:hypothetical protein